ncbi:hypothetical protein AB205_0183590, partial [Aquarana catesbeiana]
IKFKDPQYTDGYVFKAVVLQGAKKPAITLKPGDWERTNNNGRPWRPRLGFSSDRKPVHLEQSAFRTLGHVLPQSRGHQRDGLYSNAPPPGAFNPVNAYRMPSHHQPPLFSTPPS